MAIYNRIGTEKVSSILDKATEGVSLQKIADHAGVATKTVWNLMHEFPLWSYYRTKDKVGDDDQ